MRNRFLYTLSLCIAFCALVGFGKIDKLDSSIEQDTKYNAAIVHLTPEELENKGIELGDSLNVSFSNGYKLEDVPYYNGYYVKDGEPVVVAYPGFEYILVTLNNKGIWDEANLSDDDVVTISVNSKCKYLSIQEGLGQVYSFNREDYRSDAEFCNFRALTGGTLKKDYFYRGASPVDNSRGRARYTDSLLKENQIGFVLDLADSKDDIEKYMSRDDFKSSYSSSLYEKDNIALLSMGAGFKQEVYKEKLVEGLRLMLKSEGPVYIHCMEGKDRTGFVCMLMEALAGASYEEMRNDYMVTYGNYYGVTKEKTPDKYNAIAELYFDSFVSYLHQTENIEELQAADYVKDAEAYLMDGGMSDEELIMLHKYISNEN